MVPELSSSGVPQDATSLLVGYYSAAAKRLRAIVSKPPGKTQSAREWRQARAATLVGQVDQIVAELGHKSAAWVGKEMPKAALDGRKRADTQAKEAGVRPKDNQGGLAGSFHLISKGAVAVIARDAAHDLNKAAESMGDTAKTVLRKTAQIGLAESEIDRILAGGLIEGQPVATIRTLREELRSMHGEKVIIKGREFDVGYYASMVARTKTREATVKARHERLQELDLDLVAIVGLISSHFCTAFLGMVFSLSGRSTKYPAYSELPGGGPPFHPNCSKSSRPFVDSLASPKQLDMAEGLDDSDKLLGMNVSQAQRAFTDLQLQQQVRATYATTAKKLFGKAA